MIAVRGTFLDIKDEQETCRRAESAERWMQSGRRDWIRLDLDLRKELLTVGKMQAESKVIDPRSFDKGTAYLCVHNKQVCSFCRDWLTQKSDKECVGHPDDKCGKASCCVAHHQYKMARPAVKKRPRKRQAQLVC
mmetsp:Transcript_22178/g.54482  ORF Transcript_22178/g.54482 Transcript_22178/m.54482 type:complete len:135 (-) Transcript_22178:109-513(-)